MAVDALKHPHLPGLIRRYIHPTNGRTVHVAASPDAANELRRTLSKDSGDDTFDVHIQGSPEHLAALDELRTHHEQRRHALRVQHGPAYDEFEAVYRELDALAADLRQTTSRPIALDANFDRFGYSAHIRTRMPSEAAGGASGNGSGHASGVATPNPQQALTGDDGGGAEERERRRAETIKLWKPPVVRQYWHKGIIWRSSAQQEVAPFELFVDLLYVGIIGILGDEASADPTGRALLIFAVVFILAYKVWLDVTQIVAWFETDHLVQRASILFFMAIMIGYIINIEHGFDETYTELIAFYLANRLYEAVYYFWMAFLLPMVRGAMLASAISIVIPSAIWIGSIHVEEPDRWALIWIAIILDLFLLGATIPFVRSGHKWANGPLDSIVKHMQFYPAINIEHKIERMGAFVTLVFGYSVLAILFQSTQTAGISAFYGKAVMGLVIAFSFNMLYFEIDGKNLYQHAIRRHAVAFFFWQNLHLLLILAYTLASGALARIVVVRDCADAELESLSETSQLKSVDHLEAGLRWFFCAGLGAALACMGGIALTHDHKTYGDTHRLKKLHRLVVRFAIAIILVCLPLAEALNSLQLVATVMCLVLAVLIVDLLGSTVKGESMWRDKSRCSYATDIKMSKKDVEALAAEGGTLQDLAEKNGGVVKGAAVE